LIYISDSDGQGGKGVTASPNFHAGAGSGRNCFCYYDGTWDIKSLWDEFQKILGLVLGGLGGLFLLGLLTRRANGPGAVTGIIGSVFVQIWVMQSQIVHLLLYATTGFISCFIIGYIASLVMPKYNKDTDHLTVYELIKNRKAKNQ
jgi:solute:Na+ symporter, SSS family